jgi:Major Facilitator Superfamily
MMLARTAQAMVGVALVLFTLAEYQSPALTGIVTAASILPGLLIAPVAGALLDRQGRTRLVMVDYAVALVSLALIGGLALADALPVPLLLLITVVSSLTSILSATGLRSLFPLLVPERLWERVNAIDSNGYLVATIIGPPLAAALVSLFGGAVTLILIGVVFGGATIAMMGAPDPDTSGSSSGDLLRDAWDGLKYTVRNPTLRGLGISISLLNVSGGMVTIVVPLILLQRLGAPEVAVGLVFAGQGMGPARPADRRDRGRGSAAPRRRRRGDDARRGRPRGVRARRQRRVERSDGHRPLHDPPAPDRPRVARPGVRRLDGVQLPRLPDRDGARGGAGLDHVDRGGDRRRGAGRGRGRRRRRRDDPATGRRSTAVVDRGRLRQPAGPAGALAGTGALVAGADDHACW